MRAFASILAVAALLPATTEARAQGSTKPSAPPPAVVAPARAPPPAVVAPAPTPPPAPVADAAPSGLPPLTGRVFAYGRAPLRDAPIEQASTSIWLGLRPRLGPSYANVLVTGDAFAASVVPGPSVQARVREGYVGIGDERIDVRIGQQIIPWGNADAINPSDLLTARDYTFFSADPEANRLGVLSARVSWSPVTWLNVVLVGTPITPASTLLLPAALVPAGVVLHSFQAPPVTMENAEGAARVAVSGHGWDLAVLGFRGWNHTPELEPNGVESNGTIDVGLGLHRYHAAGAEASASVADWVLRAETAYVITDNPQGTNPLIQPTHWDSVVGLERSGFDGHLRVQAQGITRYHPSYEPSSSAVGPSALATVADAAIAQANAVLENYVTQLRVAATLRVAYSALDDKIGLEVFALANLNDGHDFLVRPLVTYRPTDALRFEAGAEIYGGPATSPLGALSDYSGAFLQATYEF